MSTVTIVLLVILAVLIVGLICIIFSRQKRHQKKRDEQEAQLAANSQTVSMLIIDKKRLRLKDSGASAGCHRPDTEDDAPSKLPIVKAKVGPKVMSLIATRQSMICSAEEGSQSDRERHLHHEGNRRQRTS